MASTFALLLSLSISPTIAQIPTLSCDETVSGTYTGEDIWFHVLIPLDSLHVRFSTCGRATTFDTSLALYDSSQTGNVIAGATDGCDDAHDRLGRALLTVSGIT